MSRPIECLVVDDEPLAARLIASYVERTPFLHLAGTANTAEDALAAIDGGNVDVLFLDIHMPRLSGMQLARLLPPQLLIVFTTAYADHAVEGFRVGAVDYLLKPVDYQEFSEAAKRVRDRLNAAAPQPDRASVASSGKSGYLTVKSEYRLLRLPLDEIVYIEGLKDYVKFYLSGEAKPVLSLMSM